MLSTQVACHNWYPSIIQNDTDGTQQLSSNANASESTCGDHHSKCTWSNDLFSRRSIEVIREHAHDEAPFFLYFATTTPHTGFLKGNRSQYAVPGPYDNRFPQYDQEQALFAAATSAQDDFVGAVLDELKSQGIEENTVIFFSGDNGPDSHPFNVFDDPGPFRGKKRSLHEGGIRQTITVQWKGHVIPNTTTDHLFAFWDLLPTAAELAGVPTSQWPTTDGVSAAPMLTGQPEKQDKHKFLYWESCYYGNASGLLPQQYAKGWGQAMRIDQNNTEWKAIRVDREETLLYNLTADVSESVNVAAKFPDVVKQIVALMEESHVENPYWKSNHNSSDKCCASCFSHAGCKAPCVHKNASHTQLWLPDLHPLAFQGLWTSGDVGLRVRLREFEENNNARFLVTGPGCWEGEAVLDKRTSQLSFRPSKDGCLKTVHGQVEIDGSAILVKWHGHNTKHWEKPFDFD